VVWQKGRIHTRKTVTGGGARGGREVGTACLGGIRQRIVEQDGSELGHVGKRYTSAAGEDAMGGWAEKRERGGDLAERNGAVVLTDRVLGGR
jgi:hypothetical protein